MTTTDKQTGPQECWNCKKAIDEATNAHGLCGFCNSEAEFYAEKFKDRSDEIEGDRP